MSAIHKLLFTDAQEFSNLATKSALSEVIHRHALHAVHKVKGWHGHTAKLCQWLALDHLFSPDALNPTSCRECPTAER